MHLYEIQVWCTLSVRMASTHLNAVPLTTTKGALSAMKKLIDEPYGYYYCKTSINDSASMNEKSLIFNNSLGQLQMDRQLSVEDLGTINIIFNNIQGSEPKKGPIKSWDPQRVYNVISALLLSQTDIQFLGSTVIDKFPIRDLPVALNPPVSALLMKMIELRISTVPRLFRGAS